MRHPALRRNAESVTVADLTNTDIFKMLMKQDHVSPSDLRRLCDDAQHQIGKYRSSSAAR